METTDTTIRGVQLAPSLGYRRGVYERRTHSPVLIAVHTTGLGPHTRLSAPRFARWRRKTAISDPFAAALWAYANMKAGPHYVVGQQGELAQVCPEGLCAWHVAGRNGRAYDGVQWFGSSGRYQWWFDRHHGLTSPKDFASGRAWEPYGTRTGLRVRWAARGGSVNANSIGIEVVPPRDNGPWSDSAWEALVSLTCEIALRRGIVVTPRTVLTHSDLDPLARTTPHGNPWDTVPVQFSWDEFARRSGGPF